MPLWCLGLCLSLVLEIEKGGMKGCCVPAFKFKPFRRGVEMEQKISQVKNTVQRTVMRNIQ